MQRLKIYYNAYKSTKIQRNLEHDLIFGVFDTLNLYLYIWDSANNPSKSIKNRIIQLLIVIFIF